MLGDVLLQIEKWNTTHPQITSEEKEESTNLVDKISNWIDEKVEEQKSHPSHEKPVFLTSDIVSQMKPLKNKIKALNRKPKPKPPVEKPKKEAKTNETDSTTTSESENNDKTEDVDNKDDMEPETTTTKNEPETEKDSNSYKDDEEDLTEEL